MKMFPDYEYLVSMANGMVEFNFDQYVNNGTINQEQYEELKRINKDSVAKFDEMIGNLG